MRYVTNEQRRRRTLFKPTVCLLLMTRCTISMRKQLFKDSMKKKTLISKMVLLFALCFPASAVVRVAASPSRLDIQVESTGFGNVSSHDISVLLQSAADEIWR